MSQHFLGQVTQKALIEKDGKILLVRPPDERNPLSAGKWDMPGGRLDEGEDPIEGLKREVSEEIGVEIVVREILATDVFTNLTDKKNYLVVIGATLADENTSLVLQESEVAEARWFTTEEIAEVPFLYMSHKKVIELLLK